MEYFGREWKNERLYSDHYHLYKLNNENIEFYLTEDCKDAIDDDRKGKYKDLLFYIYKLSLFGKMPIFYTDDDHSNLREITRSDVSIINIKDAINLLPKKIDEIVKWIMECLYSETKEYGMTINKIDTMSFYSYERNDKYFFFLHMIEDNKYIDTKSISGSNGKGYENIKLTTYGWNYIEQHILEGSIDNSQVFIAMWFDPSMDDAYKAICLALEKTNFQDMRIDKKQHNNEITTEIGYEIRKSKFLVAEVTGQRQGVYFEAGYAIGNKIPVIWVCREDDLKNVHFDTRQYNHIVWSKTEELTQKLIERIHGTIS